jgi:5,10-methylenetetrahydromethanopterin reductase
MSYLTGILAPATMPPRLFGRFAAAAEQAGFDELWMAEDCFLSGSIAQAAVALATTTRIGVGIGILPAAARNVAFTALEVSFLADAFPGRLMLGVGHGMTDWLRQVGAWPASPLTLLAEYLDALRALLAGQTVTTQGRYITLTDVRLDHVPATPPLVLAGVRGPKSLALSGQHADGTILAEPVTPAYVRFARSHIGAAGAAGPVGSVGAAGSVGLAGSVGSAGGHHIVAYNIAAVDDDQRRARERVRPALWCAGEPAWQAEIASLPFAEELGLLRRQAGSAAEFTRRLPGEWIDQLALAGPPETVRAQLAELHAAGAQHLIMSPVGPDPIAEISGLRRVLLPRE